jgi:putative restriction endonuclease
MNQRRGAYPPEFRQQMVELVKAGGLEENKIYLNPELVERYTGFFKFASMNDERPNPHYPFFYLRGKLANNEPSFWHLHPIHGRELLIESLAVSKASDVSNNIEFASLDSELFDLLQHLENIERFEESLTRYWFDRGHADLSFVVKDSGAISNYERKIRKGELGKIRSGDADAVRTPAFRRLVTQIYDYRCAATGIRILLPSGEAMVEAAHIHPFSEAGDDDPRNGLALTPNMHWAMDRNLIAPGPDRLWHVSRVLDKRTPDFQFLTNLEGMPLFLPSELRFSPKEESLIWRFERLRKKLLAQNVEFSISKKCSQHL